jgi:chromosome segregation ATPase
MTCNKNIEALNKMSNLIKKIREIDFVPYNDNDPDDGKLVSLFLAKAAENDKKLVICEGIREVSKLLLDCNCCSEVEAKRFFLTQTKNENSKLQDKYDDLLSKYDSLQDDYEEMKGKYENTRNEREKERVNNAREITALQKDKSSLQQQLTDTQQHLTASESKVGRLEERLEARNGEVGELNRRLDNLRLDNNRLEQSQEDLLNEKVNLKEEKLEVFANRLGIDLGQIDNLRRYYERLIHARKNYNQVNIETHERNINQVKGMLRQNGVVSVENTNKCCRKCEKVAKLRMELNEIRQQQYEARQEVSVNH